MTDDAPDLSALRARPVSPRPAGYVTTRDGDALDRLVVARAAGWPDVPAALSDAEEALGGMPWTEAAADTRLAAAQLACEVGITRACRGEGSGSPLSPADLDWLQAALDELWDRLT